MSDKCRVCGYQNLAWQCKKDDNYCSCCGKIISNCSCTHHGHYSYEPPEERDSRRNESFDENFHDDENDNCHADRGEPIDDGNGDEE